MKTLFCAAALAFATSVSAHAQWGLKWLQDESYWGDGKAEFNIYEAREVRYGQPRPSYIVHIFVRESFAPGELVKADDWKQKGTYPVLKLNQTLYIPTGIYTYQQMHSAFWKTDNGQLIKASLTSSDSCGNTYKELRGLSGWRSWFGGGWSYRWITYWQGMSEGKETVRADADSISRDELPMRIRTIDFSPGEGTFAIGIAPSIINSKKDAIAFTPHVVSWRQKKIQAEDGTSDSLLGPITVTVKPRSGTGEDVFILDSHPPYLLREWRKADGGSLKLRHTLKLDYWNYNKLGDQEKLLSAMTEDHEHDADEEKAKDPSEEMAEEKPAPGVLEDSDN
jgi:hypothetical protein